MSNIRITADILPATDVLVAAREAIDLADRIAVTIEYNFNGVPCDDQVLFFTADQMREYARTVLRTHGIGGSDAE